MTKVVGILSFLFFYAHSAHANLLFKVHGKLSSYSDKDLTIQTKNGKKKKFLFSEVYLEKGVELSRLLGKERDFFVLPTERHFPKVQEPPHPFDKSRLPSATKKKPHQS